MNTAQIAPVSTTPTKALEETYSYLEELAGIPPRRGDPEIIRYSCYLQPYPFAGCISRVGALHMAIMRHLHILKTLPLHAYVSPAFRLSLLEELSRLSGETVETAPNGDYSYRFVCATLDHVVIVRRDQDLPGFLKEIREIGLPNNAVVCVHH